MGIERHPRRVLVLAFASALVLPLPARAQCVVTNTLPSTLTMTVFIVKYLSMSTTCSTTAMNAFLCSPTAPAFVMTLSASAYTSTTNPFCSFNCGCGTVTIDGSDGLPVELMDFDVGRGRSPPAPGD